MATQLIPVFAGQINNEQEQLVDARLLHSFLGVTTKFADWIVRRTKHYSFIENQDYICVLKNEKGGKRGFQAIDYHITIDMAKELSMVERTEKGKEARRYFIECEKRLMQQPIKSIPEKPSKKLIAGGLTLEQQDAIKALVKSRVEVLPKDKQAKAAITCWSSLKSKFGKTYKAIAPEEFTNALSLVARLDLEEKVKHVQGELVESEALADENKYTVKHFKEVMEHFGYGFIDNRQHVAVNRSDFEQVKAALSVSGRMLSLLEKH